MPRGNTTPSSSCPALALRDSPRKEHRERESQAPVGRPRRSLDLELRPELQADRMAATFSFWLTLGVIGIVHLLAAQS